MMRTFYRRDVVALALVWFKQAESKARLFIPLAALVGLSFVIWGWWPGRVQIASEFWGEINFSPFPLLVPVSLWLFWQAWK